MSFLTDILPIFGLFGLQMQSQIKAQEAAARAAKFQRRQQQLEEYRAKRQIVREAYIARGNAAQGAENQGASGTSASLGGLGSIQSQMGSNISFLDKYGALSDKISNQTAKAQQYQFNSQLYGQAIDIAMAVATPGTAANSAFSNIFKRG